MSSPSESKSSESVVAAAQRPDLTVAVKSTKQLLKDFLTRQEERAQTYASFREAFDKFVDDKDSAAFSTACDTITKKFAAISMAVREIAPQLPEMWASKVRAIQELEKSKYEETILMRGLQAKHIVVTKDIYNPDFVQADREHRRKINDLIESINDILEDLVIEVRY